MVRVPPSLLEILEGSPKLGQAFLVGGCVRDALLSLPQKDFDIEVFGLDYPGLAAELSRYGRIDLVGRSFGVIKLTVPSGETFDFSLPRRDSKVGPGHKGFSVEFDPDITLREAASRRDFTINALMFNPRSGELLDFFGGRGDLEKRTLRHTSSAFTEDPLRVLRGMQFASRFTLDAAAETISLCRQIKDRYAELAVERVREEWWKWAAKSKLPSAGLKFLAEAGWIEHFPELNAIRGVPQEPEWHPEGDVFVHTCHCCDAMAALPLWGKADEESRVVYLLSVLGHDFGKALSTTMELRDGRLRIVSPGHEMQSVTLAETFCARIDLPLALRKRILPLVANHMIPKQIMSDRAIRRLSHRLEPENIQGLTLMMTADASGRPPLPAGAPVMAAHLLQRAAELRVAEAAPRPLLLGRHLLELGMSAGRPVGEILDRAYEAQLEGKFDGIEGALIWLHDNESFALGPQCLSLLERKLQL